MKTPVLKTLFNKVASLQTFLKRGSNTVVSCGYCDLFKNSFFKENLRWLLLTVPPQYSEVSLGVSYLVSCLHLLSNLIKNLRKTLHKKFFTFTWQNNVFLAWINLSRAFDFRIWENISCFQFWWKINNTNDNAQITMLLYGWSISGHDLEIEECLVSKKI